MAILAATAQAYPWALPYAAPKNAMADGLRPGSGANAFDRMEELRQFYKAEYG